MSPTFTLAADRAAADSAVVESSVAITHRELLHALSRIAELSSPALQTKLAEALSICCQLLGATTAFISTDHADVVSVIASVGLNGQDEPVVRQAEQLRSSPADFVVPFATGVDQGRVVLLGANSNCGAAELEFMTLFGRWVASAVERHRTLTDLAASEAQYRSVVDSTDEVIFQGNHKGHWTFLNRAWADLTGFAPADCLNQPMLDYLDPVDRPAARPLLRKLLDGTLQECRRELRYRRRDGSICWVELVARALPGADGTCACLTGTLRDVTARHAYEERLRLAASVFSHVREGIMITSADGLIVDTNEAFTRITGYGPDEVRGKNPRMLQSGRQGAQYYQQLWAALKAQGYWQGEIWNRRKSGECYAELLTISAVHNEDGGVSHYVGMFGDITAQKEHQNELEYLAHYDALTGLPNRRRLSEQLHKAVMGAREQGTVVAVAYLDLDGFKEVNDTYGHAAGDELLISIATKMQLAARDGDMVCRLGGDEFVIVLQDLRSRDDWLPIVQRIVQSCAVPFLVMGQTMHVTASVGVTVYPYSHSADAEQLLRQADQAMYQAKVAGKNRYALFDAEQHRSEVCRRAEIREVKNALAANQFILYYQPIIDLISGEVVAAEALIRWQHPEHGILSPASFLPTIEYDELAVAVDDWVLEAALTQLDAWQASGLNVGLSVNVGARQLQQRAFVSKLRACLNRHPSVVASRLKLEVLETSALDDIEHVSAVIRECAVLGVQFALDDFGTGYSSLLYLKRLPASYIKIDQGFVKTMLDDPDDLSILEGVLGMAAAFRRDAIAEGVESVAHARALKLLGCRYAQGYGIAKPMRAGELPGWVRNWRLPAALAGLGQLAPGYVPLLAVQAECRAWCARLGKAMPDALNSPQLLSPDSKLARWLGTAKHAAPSAQAQTATIGCLAADIDCSARAGAQAHELLPQVEHLVMIIDRVLDSGHC